MPFEISNFPPRERKRKRRNLHFDHKLSFCTTPPSHPHTHPHSKHTHTHLHTHTHTFTLTYTYTNTHTTSAAMMEEGLFACPICPGRVTLQTQELLEEHYAQLHIDPEKPEEGFFLPAHTQHHRVSWVYVRVCACVRACVCLWTETRKKELRLNMENACALCGQCDVISSFSFLYFVSLSYLF